jgi:hypothetical protein
MTTELARLAEHRPTSDDLEALWRADRRDRVLGDVVAAALDPHSGDPSPRPLASVGVTRRRRLLALGGAAAAAALVVTLAPAFLSPGTLPTAGAIDRLAATAGRGTALVIPQGKFLHLVVRDSQRGGGESATGTRTLESWTASDGRVWRKDTDNGRVSYFAFPALRGGPVDLSPAGVARLPTDAGELLDLLEGRVEGSTSVHEAVFVAVGDMTRMGYTPPAVRAAAIRALGRLPEVSATEGDGRVTLTYVDQAARLGVRQSLVFDAATTALVAETLNGPDLSYSSQTQASDVVGNVPPSVEAGAASTPAKQATGSTSR